MMAMSSLESNSAQNLPTPDALNTLTNDIFRNTARQLDREMTADLLLQARKRIEDYTDALGTPNQGGTLSALRGMLLAAIDSLCADRLLLDSEALAFYSRLGLSTEEQNNIRGRKVH